MLLISIRREKCREFDLAFRTRCCERSPPARRSDRWRGKVNDLVCSDRQCTAPCPFPRLDGKSVER